MDKIKATKLKYIIKDGFNKFKSSNADLNKRLIHSFTATLLITFTVLIFYPLEYYLSNTKNLIFNVFYILPYIIVFSVLFLVIITVVSMLFKKRFYEIIYSLVFSIGVCFWLQGNFLNGVITLNGSPFYQSWKRVLLSTFVWSAIILINLFFTIFFNRIYKKFSLLISVILICIQAITLIILLISTDYSIIKNRQYINGNQNYNMSNEKNIIVLIIDAYSQSIFEEQRLTQPEIETIFKDFTYYNNYISPGWPTRTSIPYLFTGTPYKNDVLYDEYKNNAYSESTFIKQLNDLNFDVSLYASKDILPDDLYLAGNVDNVFKSDLNDNISNEHKFEIIDDLYKIIFIRCMPQLLKPLFWVYPQFESYVFFSDDYIPYTGSNEIFNERTQNNEWSLSDNYKFKYIHINGYHWPIINYSYIQTGEVVNSAIDEYLKKLKEYGVYDNSFIIITSDHGSGNYFEPGYHVPLLIKDFKNDNDKMQISDAPVSHNQFIPTVLWAASGKNIYGLRFQDINFDNAETRVHYVANNWKTGFCEEYVEIYVGNDPNDILNEYTEFKPNQEPLKQAGNWYERY